MVLKSVSYGSPICVIHVSVTLLLDSILDHALESFGCFSFVSLITILTRRKAGTCTVEAHRELWIFASCLLCFQICSSKTNWHGIFPKKFVSETFVSRKTWNLSRSLQHYMYLVVFSYIHMYIDSVYVLVQDSYAWKVEIKRSTKMLNAADKIWELNVFMFRNLG